MNYLKSRIIKIIICLMISPIFFQAGYCQDAEALTLEKVKNALEGELNCQEVVTLISEYGVIFELDTEKTVELARLGACNDLFSAIENNFRVSEGFVEIEYPTEPGCTCGPIARLGGSAEKIDGMYLWLFVHRADLGNEWWPQVGEVSVSGEGRWSQNAYVGRPEDAGFMFEFLAIWVSPQYHRKMITKLENRDYSGERIPSSEMNNPHDFLKCQR